MKLKRSIIRNNRRFRQYYLLKASPVRCFYGFGYIYMQNCKSLTKFTSNQLETNNYNGHLYNFDCYRVLLWRI
jgi:hypothetical protein